MKTRSFALGCACICCALAVPPPVGTAAAIDDQQFNELKDLVTKLGQKIEKQEQRIEQLEKTHTQDARVHAQDQKTHEQDQQKIQELQQKLGETQQAVSNVQTAAIAVPVEPLPRVPLDEATVNHNFSILGDAEIQYAKTSGQHGTFLFADFAPIFLYRGGEKVLFEAGFDFGLQNNAPNSPGATTTINLSFAQLDYLMNDYVTLVAGDMVLPLGTYSERTAGWFRTWEPVKDGTGEFGCAVVLDPASIDDVAVADGNQVVIARQPARYWAGAGWDKSGDFAGVADWDRYVEQWAKRVASPLKVQVTSE